MVHWGVVAAALFGSVMFPFVVIAFHQLLASAERRERPDRGDVDPPSVHEPYRSRTIPGGKGRRGD